MNHKVVLAMMVLAAFFPLSFVAGSAYAQPASYAAAAPRIDGFDVESVPQPTPGSELVFILYGSPGGAAAVKIDGATGTTVLVETEPGVYEGTYTIRQRDRITAGSLATACANTWTPGFGRWHEPVGSA